MEKVKISTEYITLGQFLKLMDIVETGGEVKDFLMENKIIVNEKICNERGKKIYPGDILEINYIDETEDKVSLSIKVEKEV